MTPILVRDLLMNMLLGLTALVVLVLAQINPIAKNNPDSTKPPGAIAVTIAWPAGNYDVDLWVIGPGEKKAVGYSNKSGVLFSLLRDDLGITNDSGPLNLENAFARDMPAGEYIINIHGFSIGEKPLPVHIEVSLGRETMTLLVNTDMDIGQKQERTVVRFSLDDQGRVIPESVNRVFRPLRSATK
jgi:hypothetical protein